MEMDSESILKTYLRPLWIKKTKERLLAVGKDNLLIKDTKELWKVLELVIGTANDIEIRRVVKELFMEVKNASQVNRFYFSGSRSEAFKFYWSDLDIMWSILVWNVAIQGKGCTNINCHFIAYDVDCQPGFCKLLSSSYDCATIVDDDVYFSRIRFLCEEVKIVSGKYVKSDTRINGPCHTLVSTYAGVDMCYALPIHPTSSNEFLKRFSTKFWNNIKLKILEENIIVMHVVPKGPPEGDTKGIQWLKSFSVLEKHIVHSLNHVQFCCYGLLKILIHFEVEIWEETQDTLCSYHLKTVLFHVLEDIHSDFWIPSNIFYCLWICLTRLLLFIKRGNCPNYFVPECNLFLKKRVLEKRCKIEEALLRVLQSGTYVLFYVNYLSLLYPANLLQNVPKLLRKHVELCSGLAILSGYHTTYHECMWSILKVIHLIQIERNDIKRTVLKYLFSLLLRRAGIILYEKFVLTGFKEYLLTAEAAFILTSHSDASGALYLATLWHCQGKFRQAINIVSITLKKLPDTDPPITSYNIPPVYDLSKPWCNFRDLMRRYSFFTIELYKGSSFLPKALENVLRRDSKQWQNFLMYDKSYALFLMFLCHLAVHEKENCIQMRNELYKSYNESRFKSYILPQQQQNSKILGSIVERKMIELTGTC